MRLRVLPAVLAAVATAATPVVAAPPNGRGPGCGGYWNTAASCSFVPVAGLPILFGGFAVSQEGIALIKVSVHVGTPTGPVIGSCSAAGATATACQGQTATALPGIPHWCVVSGVREGAYGCVQDP